MSKYLLIPLIVILISISSIAQMVDYTAKDQVTKYEGYFRPGVNMGYYPPYTDDDLANIAAGNAALGLPGAGIKAARPGLFDEFTAVWGYDSRLDSYQHFYDLGLRDLTCIVGFPAEWNREHVVYCDDGVTESEMFAGLYTDIWDDGTDGTPYNDENLYAAYLYEVVSRYKDYIEFWEIWNEPGFDYTYATGWQLPGSPSNWWDFNPDPCDYKLRAPIFHYIRTLRISWEIIKHLDPESYVCVAGVGFTSFLDAVLRNTDNPVDGSATTAYPHGGGAYFDVMGFHSYPDIDGSVRYWDNSIGGFVYERHSDAAARGIDNTKSDYQAVLDNYGYDGVTYPEKEWIITEINVPRQAFNPESIGDQDVQINYMIKAYVTAMKNDILQMHVYNLIDIEKEADADYEYDLMGIYKNIDDTQPYGALQMNTVGTAYKTSSDILFESRYDAARTNALNLPEGVQGGAFLHEDGKYTYVLWAETTIDKSEAASATYSFSDAWGIEDLEKRTWDYSLNGFNNTIGIKDILLNGRPIFLTETGVVEVPFTASFNADNTEGCLPLEVQFSDQSIPVAEGWTWTFVGGTPATSTERNPVVTYNEAGTFEVILQVTDGTSIETLTEISYITVSGEPTVAFTSSMEDPTSSTIHFDNQSSDVDIYRWNFGDGTISNEITPEHTYEEDGTYLVELAVFNNCGGDSIIQEVVVQTVVAPAAEFTSNTAQGCAPFEVSFSDMSTNSPNEWNWSFSGGTPATSTEENPVVTYESAGVYTVVLQVTNEAGTDVIVGTDYITIGAIPTANFNTVIEEATIILTNSSVNADSYIWDFGDGNTSTDSSPFHTYEADGEYTIQLTAGNDCGSTTITNVVNIQTVVAPLAAFTADTLSGCAPFIVQFNDESTNEPTEWLWSFSGGNPTNSIEQNPIITFENPGTYTIVMQASNSAGATTTIETDYIVVDSEPTAEFLVTMDGSSSAFVNLSENADSYSWDFGDGNISTEENPVHTYMMDGSYLVSLITSNECGEASYELEVSIEGAAFPIANFSADMVGGCAPIVVQFFDQSTNSPSSWSWLFPGGTPAMSTEESPSITYDEPGIYEVTLAVSNVTGSNVVTKTEFIQVDGEPSADFSAVIVDETVTLINNSTGGGSALWDFGDGNTSNEDSPMHTFEEPGDYLVTLTLANFCGFDAIQQTITIDESTAVEELTAINDLQIFPNPTNGKFHLQMAGQSVNQLEIRILNILGQEMHQEEVDFRLGQFQKTYDINHLAKGTYLIQISSEDATITRKLIKGE